MSSQAHARTGGRTYAAAQLHTRLRNQLRRAVSGSDSVSLREVILRRVKDEIATGQRSRTRDIIYFTLGVVNMCLTQFFLTNQPRYFWVWYSCWAIPLLVWRWFTFTLKKWQYFMLDYCYSVNALCAAHLFIAPSSRTLFHIAFASANGPLAFAIVAWRNSLVFHDLERFSSLFIHIMPPMLMFCHRWLADTRVQAGAAAGGAAAAATELPAYLQEDGASYVTHMLYPLGFYLAWQVAYYYKTEIADAAKLARDPEILTSLRWMTRRPEGPLYDVAVSAARWIGYIQPHERIEENSHKVKLLFMATQFIYTAVTLLPTMLMYNNMYIHLAFLIFWSVAATYNGATFYFQVFAKRYLHEIGEIAHNAARKETERVHEAAVDAVLRMKHEEAEASQHNGLGGAAAAPVPQEHD